jgi:murein DD-endopeptidase MepM/ murein hydrolase activator NlpD
MTVTNNSATKSGGEKADNSGVHKSRKTIRVVFRLFIFCGLAGVVWYVYGAINRANAEHQAKTVIPAPSPPQPLKALVELVEKKAFIVKKGDTFFGILSQHGLSRDLSNAVYHSLKSLGLQTIFPGDSIVVTKGQDSSLTNFSVLSRFQNWYHCSLRQDTVTAKKTPVNLAVYRCLVRGVLTTSLSEDLFKLGIGDACVAMFADIFAWDINFFVDPQKGDSFEIVVEKKYAEGRFTGYGNILAARYVNNGRIYTALGLAKQGGIFNYYDLKGKSLQKQFLKAPLRFSHISSRFSFHRRHPILGIVRPHLGIDYAAPIGTPVYAAADGTVRKVEFNAGFGRLVRIYHGGSYETYYGHLNSFANGLCSGEKVKQGDCIGLVGQTGLATGPHLDYRMTRRGCFVNPLTVSLPSKDGIAENEKTEFLMTKEEFEAIFTLRMTGNSGYFVVDTETRSALGEKIQEIKTTGATLGNALHDNRPSGS